MWKKYRLSLSSQSSAANPKLFSFTCNMTSNSTSETWSSVFGRHTVYGGARTETMCLFCGKLLRYKKYYFKCRWMNHGSKNMCCGDGVSLTFLAVMQCFLIHCTSNHLFTCNTDLRIGEEGSTVHTKRPLSQPTTNTEPDKGLEWRKAEY